MYKITFLKNGEILFYFKSAKSKTDANNKFNQSSHKECKLISVDSISNFNIKYL